MNINLEYKIQLSLWSYKKILLNQSFIIYYSFHKENNKKNKNS
jgi:hypothetical protein